LGDGLGRDGSAIDWDSAAGAEAPFADAGLAMGVGADSSDAAMTCGLDASTPGADPGAIAVFGAAAFSAAGLDRDVLVHPGKLQQKATAIAIKIREVEFMMVSHRFVARRLWAPFSMRVARALSNLLVASVNSRVGASLPCRWT